MNPLDSISHLSMLDADEQRRLLATGDLEDRNKVIESCLRFAKLQAQRFSKTCSHLSIGDLVSEATVGLIEAAKRYDPEKQVQFLTYANWWMVRQMLNAQERQTPVYLPRYVYAKGVRLRAVSLDSPQNDRDDTTLADALADPRERPDELQERLSDERVVLSGLDDLDGRVRRVLRLRFWRGQTLKVIGESMGISRERVRQMEKEGFVSLKFRVGRRVARRP